ncbi:MAG: hypothetical protein ACRDHY_06640, partial [Anaerolineales bacterium]
GYSPRVATAIVVEQSPTERFGRVVSGLVRCWGLALVSLFIPVAHFILVPAFAVAGVVVAVKRAREDRRLVLLRGACPRCGTEQELKPGGRFAGRRGIVCPKCHGNLTLVTTDSAD